MYINIHVLYTLAGANPNRDDVGSPKSLTYGGVERSRISSQAMTRAKRRAYESDPAGEKSYRSTQLGREIAAQATRILEEAGIPVDESLAAKVEGAAKTATSALTAKEKKEGDAAPKDTLVWLAESEIRSAASKIADKYKGDSAIEDLTAGDLAQTRTTSLAIASFGRMFANRPELQTEAAIQRADAFTTHRGDIDIDYFTAVDDLAETQGAGHLGTKLQTGGVYYWHCNINVRELLSNWTDSESPEAKERLTALIRALILALPTGGENTHAHHSLPVAVLAVPARRPLSLQSAFESAVPQDLKSRGYVTTSIERLSDEHAATMKFLPSAFFEDAPAVSATLQKIDIRKSDSVKNLDELAGIVADWVLADRAS